MGSKKIESVIDKLVCGCKGKDKKEKKKKVVESGFIDFMVGNANNARIFYPDGRVVEYISDALALDAYHSLGRGVRAAFRARGDSSPVYSYDFVDEGFGCKGKKKKKVAEALRGVPLYKEALKQAERIGAGRAEGYGLLAQTIKSLSLFHAINPEEAYKGAVVQGLTAKEVKNLPSVELGDLMFIGMGESKKIKEAFMEPEIVQGTWYEIDGPAGIAFYNVDILGPISEIEDEYEPDETGAAPKLGDMIDWEEMETPAGLLDYIENPEVWNITKREGYGARMSAPGYLDSTDWSVYDTEEEAEEELKDMYSDEEGNF